MGGPHRQGQVAVAGPNYLDGSAFNPEIVELRRAGSGYVTMTVVPVAPPCFDASDDDAMEEDWLEAQMQDMFDIDHAEAAMIDEP